MLQFSSQHTIFHPFNTEPGYYEVGKFGIRLETIVEVVKANVMVCIKNNGPVNILLIG